MDVSKRYFDVICPLGGKGNLLEVLKRLMPLPFALVISNTDISKCPFCTKEYSLDTFTAQQANNAEMTSY